MKKSEKISFRITEDQKRKVEQLAKLQGMYVNRLVRNWISVFIENTLLNNHTHYYELSDGRQFQNMKALCKELNISSHAARKRIKSGLLKKIAIDPNHANKYGNEQIPATRSGITQKDRVRV